jgi:hypothetical protein
MSSFAERFFWARRRSGLGAPTIAEAVGCGQALISNIERTNAKSSGFNDQFAELFGVDANWLRHGAGKVPEGFDPAEAERSRQAGQGVRRAAAVNLAEGRPQRAGAAEREGATDEDRADALEKTLLSDFQDYARIVGRKRATGFIQVLQKILLLVRPVEKSQRDGE